MSEVQATRLFGRARLPLRFYRPENIKTRLLGSTTVVEVDQKGFVRDLNGYLQPRTSVLRLRILR